MMQKTFRNSEAWNWRNILTNLSDVINESGLESRKYILIDSNYSRCAPCWPSAYVPLNGRQKLWDLSLMLVDNGNDLWATSFSQSRNILFRDQRHERNSLATIINHIPTIINTRSSSRENLTIISERKQEKLRKSEKSRKIWGNLLKREARSKHAVNRKNKEAFSRQCIKIASKFAQYSLDAMMLKQWYIEQKQLCLTSRYSSSSELRKFSFF